LVEDVDALVVVSDYLLQGGVVAGDCQGRLDQVATQMRSCLRLLISPLPPARLVVQFERFAAAVELSADEAHEHAGAAALCHDLLHVAVILVNEDCFVDPSILFQRKLVIVLVSPLRRQLHVTQNVTQVFPLEAQAEEPSFRLGFAAQSIFVDVQHLEYGTSIIP